MNFSIERKMDPKVEATYLWMCGWWARGAFSKHYLDYIVKYQTKHIKEDFNELQD